MVRGFGGHFCFDFLRLRFFDMSSAVLTTTETAGELDEGTTGSGGGGGGGGTDGSIFCKGWGVGMGGGKGGGDGATAAGAAGDAIELSEPGLDATVAGLAPSEADSVTFETLPPVTLLVLGHPSNDPSWLGDNAPEMYKNIQLKFFSRCFSSNLNFKKYLPNCYRLLRE